MGHTLRRSLASLGLRDRLLPAVRSARAGDRCRTWALLVDSFEDPAVVQYLDSLVQLVQDRGHRLEVWCTEYLPDLDAARRAVTPDRVDGLIALAGFRRLSAAIALFDGLPGVVVGAPVPFRDCVIPDGARAGALVARMFADNAKTTVAVVGDVGASADVLDGFRDGARTYGLFFGGDCSIVDCVDTVEAGAAAVERVTATAVPDAILALSGRVATGLVDGLRNVGLLLPAHTWLVAFGDAPALSLPAYQVTAVAAPAAELCRRALDLLQDVTTPAGRAPRLVRVPAAPIHRATSSVLSLPEASDHD